MSAVSDASPAERHRLVAAGIADEVEATTDWSARSPVAEWAARDVEIQVLLDGDATREFTHPHVGTMPLAEAVDRFYTADVFMHTWDLAQAGLRRPDLDHDLAADLLAGMRPLADMLRSSGQYGPAYPVSGVVDPVVGLVAFIGRDPRFAD
ncbi:DinB family protein [Gordonia sp. MP11Mi]|uniref:TIGR03086 family protein n=1 Tax=Gordonia sp. MP11Mi TaxID=3022769 RepID=A0AA97GVB2_9ACTN